MVRPKIGFLPAFFVALAIAFCAALWLRLRSYDSPEALPHTTTTVLQRAADASSAPLIAPRPPSQDTIADQTTPALQQGAVRTPNTRDNAIPIELQNAPPLPAATAKRNAPAPKASFLSRLVAPIVNAISGGAHAAPSHSSSTPQAQQSAQAGSSSSGNRNSSTDTGTTDKNDRTSDTQPPQLLAISFNPPQIHDGEETVLTVQASDDLSGIRSISGTIIAPSNAVQGFALQRQFETDQYVAHITVPKDAAEGVWRVNYLSLIDNASNATTIAGAQGALPPTATFKVVSSHSDSTGPTLKGVWVDKPAIRGGDKDTVFVDASDDQSGVNLISGVFISPSRQARIGFACRQGSGPWECELASPTCIDCGDWHLEQIQLQDKANNMTTVRSDNPLVGNVRISISSEHCDNAPPTLQSLALDRPSVSNVEDTFINVTAVASDDSCGTMSMSAQVTGPVSGARLYVPFTQSGDQMWTGRISVPRLAAKGVWRITWVQVLDQGHNLKTYSQGDAALANAAFTVQ